jgi:hypothetical protein
MRRMLLPTIAVAIAVLAAPADARTEVTIGDQFHAATLVAPNRLSLWASDSLLDLRWSGWGGATATATGKVSTHAYGDYRYHPARVTASRLGPCGRHMIYTRLRYTRDGRWHSAHLFHCRFSA